MPSPFNSTRLWPPPRLCGRTCSPKETGATLRTEQLRILYEIVLLVFGDERFRPPDGIRGRLSFVVAEIAGVERKIHFSTPMTDRTSMILQWVYRNDTEEQVSSADVVAFDRAVTLEDKRILESCDADVPLADTDGEEMHMRTDYPGVVMRRMLAKLVADHGETEQRAGG